MFTLHRIAPADLDFLVHADLQTGVEEDGALPDWTSAKYALHREKIAAFTTDPDKGGLLTAVDSEPVGMLLYRLQNRFRAETLNAALGFGELAPDLFPPSGDFCEVFQLWVAPDWRRHGLARALKQQLEVEMRAQHIGLIYTHTLARYTHILALNRQLGYREVRRGPIWDDAERVSLIKQLIPATPAHLAE